MTLCTKRNLVFPKSDFLKIFELKIIGGFVGNLIRVLKGQYEITRFARFPFNECLKQRKK